MIRKFRHKGLAKFFVTGSRSGIRPAHAARLKLILAILNAATGASDMGLPGLNLHPLKGELKGRWAVEVSGNWRVTFSITGTDADDIDYDDYHQG